MQECFHVVNGLSVVVVVTTKQFPVTCDVEASLYGRRKVSPGGLLYERLRNLEVPGEKEYGSRDEGFEMRSNCARVAWDSKVFGYGSSFGLSGGERNHEH